MKKVEFYATPEGREPCKEWIDDLDVVSQAKILTYIDRVAAGGGKRNVTRIKDGEGVFEITIDYGPGFRVYFGEIGNTIMLLLIGGDKKTQTRDIELAKKYWRSCRV